MKKIKFFFMAALSAMMLGACSEDKLIDDPGGSTNPDVEDGVFFSLAITLPNAPGSRSETADPGDTGESASKGGTEIGQDYENSVKEVIVVLADPDDYSFVAAATVKASDLKKGNKGTQYTVNSKFSKTDLADFYSTEKEKYEASVFVFCNPTQDLRDAIFKQSEEAAKTDWVNAKGTITTSSTIWSRDNFFMSNSQIAKRQIPKSLDDWNYYTDESKPFDLSGNNTDVNINNEGPIRVQRGAARFDFRDGSAGDCTYEVVTATILNGTQEQEVKAINIELQKMALVNVSNSFYFLERVSPTGTETGATICSPEKPWSFTADGGINMTPPGNFVVDTDPTWKTNIYNDWFDGEGTIPTDFASYFHYPFFNENGVVDNNNVSNDRWATSLIKDVLNGDPDNDEGWNQEPKQDYRIWRYATENTIPAVGEATIPENLAKSQINGISTGVVFKGKMKINAAATTFIEGLTDEQKEANDVKNFMALVDAVNNTAAATAGTEDPVIYLYAGNLYLGWENVKNAAIAAASPEFKWNPSDKKWELVYINRSASLYAAVFGDNGGFGTYTFRFKKVNEDGSFSEEYDYYEYTDTQAVNPDCANEAYKAWTKDADSKASDELRLKFKNKVTDEDMAIYERSNDPNFGWGYYCYYYYWNRHHDNGNNGVMGPMEFAVVRNNVYKLAVTKIKRLGHPRISENDPDKPTPGTPDEKEDVYLSVQAEILPWVVRLNDIEF